MIKSEILFDNTNRIDNPNTIAGFENFMFQKYTRVAFTKNTQQEMKNDILLFCRTLTIEGKINAEFSKELSDFFIAKIIEQ